MMKRAITSLLICLLAAACFGCGHAAQEKPKAEKAEETQMDKTLHLYINGEELGVEWLDNDAVRALAERASAETLTVEMHMYGGFEQVGPLGERLPQNDSRTTTRAGDIVLYSGDQIVVFYGSNTWAYTRLGRITDRSDAALAQLLGSGDVTLELAAD